MADRLDYRELAGEALLGASTRTTRSDGSRTLARLILRWCGLGLHPEVEAWFLDLCRTDPTTADLVAEAIDVLAGAWYRSAIPLDDSRFTEHLTALKREEQS